MKKLIKNSQKNFTSQQNPYSHTVQKFKQNGKDYHFYSLNSLNDKRLLKLPYSIRVVLESAVRNCDQFEIKKQDINNILDWEKQYANKIEIPFKPARVLLQDFTGVPCLVDLATMRNAMADLKGDPRKINPLVPVDLVIDHSVQADVSGTLDAAERNEEIEFKRNYERFAFLKWGQENFQNFKAVPPGSGIVHQVNLEYLARVVMENKGLLYPDSCVGTDSHTTMINGLGVTGWGVGGIEAESVMLGQAISMVLPEVVGFKLHGKLKSNVTATDLVLTCTQILRQRGVVGKFVEFFGPGLENLTLADRATVANMAPEYGATMGFFPIDQQTLEYLKLTGRDSNKLKLVETYARENALWRDPNNEANYSGKIIELDLASVEPCISGPKRPHDRVLLSVQKKEWNQNLVNQIGPKGYGLQQDTLKDQAKFVYEGKEYTLKHGDIVISAITSCTNTSNPDSLIAAGLLAKNAVNKGLTVNPFIKTTLSPGSRVVTDYFNESGLTTYLNKLGYTTAGYGCMTCIGNSGDIPQQVTDAIKQKKLVVAAILSGNRNFEGRVHPETRANYLASPALVVAYALAGTVNIDFETDPIGKDQNGKPVYLRDIWPSKVEIKDCVNKFINHEMFTKNYEKIAKGTKRWNELQVSKNEQFNWDPKSTYITKPPYFDNITQKPQPVKEIKNAYVLANFGDFITTDHISPAGNISEDSPAAKFLKSQGVDKLDFNSYGSRRGNDKVMARGTFANKRLINKLVDKVGPRTIYVPTGEDMFIYDAAEKYQKEGHQLIVLAGNEYGSGSSRDWAAKGPYLQGVKAVIAQTYERIHRSNLIGMGILPLQFLPGQSADSLGLNGKEQFSIPNGGHLNVQQKIKVSTSNGKQFEVLVRLDTDVEIQYYENGGILQYVLRKIAF